VLYLYNNFSSNSKGVLMDMLGKDCLLQLVLEHFQEDIAKSVNFVTGEVGVAYSDLPHNLVFCVNLSLVEKIYPTS
ncbi:hypothetical protein, partial [Vibrio sp. 10N.286.55.E12]|uniref:hypothetical protein n=2 Tax=Vibrionaceae TaxID=641 RepID=UPI001F539DEF